MNQFRPRPAAPPPTPSFNASIEHLLPRKETPEAKTQSVPTPKPRKQNILGLTPASLDQASESEDDEGEEERLAARVKPSGHALQFEYKGRVATLRTPEEIAAWIAERKKRYPTQAKAEAAKKEAEEKKRKWEEEKQARLEAKREAWARRDQERKEQERMRRQHRQSQQQEKERQAHEKDKDLDPAALAKSRAEKLRKRALKAERELAEAEEALRQAEANAKTSTTQPATDETAQASANAFETPHAEVESLDPSSHPGPGDADFTSSSGSSGTDSDSENESASEDASDSASDSAPEVVSTKQAAMAVDHATLPPAKKPGPISRPCKNLIRFGRCKFGSHCRFSHEKPKDGDDMEKTANDGRADPRRKKTMLSHTSTTSRRKGLFQLMVEKEQEEERQRLLEAIITLGENGILDEPTTTGPSSG